MKREKLDPENLKEELSKLPGWSLVNNAIERDFQFSDFSEAFGFLARVAMLSERMDHHAEWWGVYNKVKLRLNTHDAGGITGVDLKMASQIQEILGK